MAKVFAIWSSGFFDVTWKPRGAIHSTKIPTGPTGKSGPPQKVDQFIRNFVGWTEPIHWVLDRNCRKFWLNREEKCDVTLPALFLNDNKTNDDGDVDVYINKRRLY